MYKGIKHQSYDSSVVYWIHKPNQTDITKDGYIGFTSRPVNDRWIDHRSAAKVNGNTSLLYEYINTCKDLIWEIVLVADDRDYCKQIEGLLRPSRGIGWNIAKGGVDIDNYFGGEANKQRWLKYWKDNPIEAADRWWASEYSLLKKQYRDHLASLPEPIPHTSHRNINSNNKSGLKGVTWYPNKNKWRCQIGYKGVVYTLGYYDDPLKANQRVLNAEAYVMKVRRGELHIEDLRMILKTKT